MLGVKFFMLPSTMYREFSSDWSGLFPTRKISYRKCIWRFGAPFLLSEGNRHFLLLSSEYVSGWQNGTQDRRQDGPAWWTGQNRTQVRQNQRWIQLKNGLCVSNGHLLSKRPCREFHSSTERSWSYMRWRDTADRRLPNNWEYPKKPSGPGSIMREGLSGGFIIGHQ